MVNQVILTCPFCGWMQPEAAHLAELPTVCNQCQEFYKPGFVPAKKISVEKTTTPCLHLRLQDAGGMAYCPDCGVTEW
jgi:hypothetical protein